MKTIYCRKDGRGHQEFPVPDDIENYHAIEVTDDFTAPSGHRYDSATNTFVAKTLTKDVTDGLRRAAYTKEVDPLMAEAQIKRAMGLVEQADALMAQAIAAREAIQVRYPKPA